MQKLLLGLVGLIGLTANAIAAPEENFIRKPAFHNFVDKMVAKHGFNSIELINILSQAKVQPVPISKNFYYRIPYSGRCRLLGSE